MEKVVDENFMIYGSITKCKTINIVRMNTSCKVFTGRGYGRTHDKDVFKKIIPEMRTPPLIRTLEAVPVVSGIARGVTCS